MPRHRPIDPQTIGYVVPLSRPQLLAVLIVLMLLVAALLFGLGFTLFASLGIGSSSLTAPTPQGGDTDPGLRRDRIAAAPMATVAEDAGMAPGIAINLPAASTLPAATTVGASGVPTGFPHTPDGAAAQLAAIEVRVLSAMSLPLTTDVYREWALPGGVGASGWSQTRNVQSFLTHARQSSYVLDPGTLVNVTPAAVQIKGSDGPDWVVACVLLDVRAALKNQARMGYGTCERLQWTGDRWLIAPGTPPAPAPSTWPGSDASVRAGWLPVTPS